MLFHDIYQNAEVIDSDGGISFWTQQYTGKVPMLGLALHDGHRIRRELKSAMHLLEHSRLREEDPYTGKWANICENRVVANFSRFEVDLNRPKHKAVYRTPEDAWGLDVYNSNLTTEMVETSHYYYDRFYKNMFSILDKMVRAFGYVVVLDFHTYNHRRDGSMKAPARKQDNPEINLGTGTLINSQPWMKLINRFICDVSGFSYQDRTLDVRENVKFKGGYFAKWAHSTFPKNVCVLSIEVKKFFMDEWSGKADMAQVQLLKDVFSSAIPGILEEVEKLSSTRSR